MRSANFVQETTTSIAGTAGNGAVTLTAIALTPRFSTPFGTQATTVRYVIEDTVGKRFESGIGSVAFNVLTRTRPQVTWDGTTWDDTAPSPLAFGSTPAAGAVVIRISATAESFAPAIPGFDSTLGSDPWTAYPITHGTIWNNNGGAGNLTVADRAYFALYELNTSGRLTGVQCEIVQNLASSNMKVALYSCGHNGLPGQKIVDFNTVSTATTGIKTDTATGTWSPAGPMPLTPGWYYVGFICSGIIGVRGFGSGTGSIRITPLGKSNGYGNGNTVYQSGSYASGLPALPAPTNLVGAHESLSVPWFGLRVEP